MLYRYYQTEHKGAWKACLADQIDKIEGVLHVTVLSTDIVAAKGEKPDLSSAKYWGNFLVDIDHGTQEGGITASIDSANKIMAFLLPMINNPSFIKLYASGGKGFHIELPWQLFFSKKRVSKELPDIYKGVAKAIEVGSEATGIDYALYAKSRGHMIRVANKPREDGAFKVPISYSELLNMTEASYRELCSKTRSEYHITSEIPVCTGLVRILQQAEKGLKNKPTYTAAATEVVLEGFGEVHPECVNKITNWEDIKDTANFNAVAVQLAIYLKSVEVSEHVADTLISETAENGHSSTYRTQEERVRHITEDVSKHVHNLKFSCAAMKNLITLGTACSTCKVHQNFQKSLSNSLGILQTPEGYFSVDKDGDVRQLTNFILEVDEIYYLNEHTGRTTVDWVLAKVAIISPYGEVLSYKEVVIDTFLDSKAFKRVFLQNREASIITANSSETTAIMHHLLKSSQGKPGMKYITQAGLQRITYTPEGQTAKQTPLVWVEREWSIASDGLVKAFKLRNEPHNMVQQENRTRISVLSDYQNDTLARLLKCSNEYVVGVLLGWVAATQVKEHIMHRIKEFPLLHVYGIAGSGKTSMASLFSALGSADYQRRPISVSNTTHHALREMAYSSTSIPRIFDECGKEKVKPTYWPTVKEVLKSCYQQSAMNIGGISSKQKIDTHNAVTYTERATAPIIYLSTVASDEAELWERSIELKIGKERLTHVINKTNFDIINDDPERWEALFDVAKLIMMKAMYSKEVHIYKLYQEALAEVPASFDIRAKKSYAYVYLGLRFFKDVMEYAEASQEVLQALADVTHAVKNTTTDTEEEFTKQNSRTEFDNYFEKLNQALSNLDHNNNPALRSNIHYLRIENTLYLNMESAHMEYMKICRITGSLPEFRHYKQFLASVEGYEIFLGAEKLPSILGGLALWHKFDIRKLEERGIDCGRYQQEL